MSNELLLLFCSLHGVLIPLEASNLADGIKVSKGDIVTFSFDSINFQSLPSHIKIVRVRNDVTWKDVSILYNNIYFYSFILIHYS